ncbi:MAG: ABC transporter ATP-binding protein [Pseudomonadota bacterium]
MLKVRSLSKSYPGADGEVTVLSGVDLDLAAGETLALTGESGSGKSTLLHLIGGLDVADGGQILLDGAEVANGSDAQRAAFRRDVVGIIFQQFNLIPSMDVAANIAFQARLSGTFDAAGTREIAARLGLADHMTKYPEALSGGQQQRVAIARVLAARPKLVLADEPTGNLDEDTANTVLSEMLSLVADAGAAMLVVTHSQSVAARMDRRVRLHAGRVA